MDLMKYFLLKKYNVLTLLFLSTTIIQAQYTKQINTNRPSHSMGAYAVGEKTIQLEGGYTHQEYYSDEELPGVKSNEIDIDIRVGAFFEQLEFLAQVNYIDANTFNGSISGFQTIELGAKLLIFDSYKNYEEKINIYSWKANQRYRFRRLVPTIALYAGYQFNTPKNHIYPTPDAQSVARLITQQHLSKKWTFVTNWYAENLEDDMYTNYGYIATLSFAFNYKTSLFIENEGKWINKNINAPTFDDTLLLRAGTTYRINNNMQIDTSLAHTISQTPKHWQLGIGLSWRNQRPTVWKDPYENINP